MGHEVSQEFKDFIAEYAGKKIKVHYDEDEDWYWVGVKEKYHGMVSEMPIASGMRKEVAETLLRLIEAVR